MVDSVFTTLAISSLFFQTALAKGGGGTGSSSHGSGGGESSSSKSSPSKSGSGSNTIHHTTPICYNQYNRQIACPNHGKIAGIVIGSIVGALVIGLLIYYLWWKPRRHASLRSRSVGQETGAFDRVKECETGGLGSWFRMSRRTKPAVQVKAEHDDLGLEHKRILSYPASPSGSEVDKHEYPKAYV